MSTISSDSKVLEHMAGGVATAISIIHQHPATWQVVVGVVLGDGPRSSSPICDHFLTFSLIEIIILPKKTSKPFSRNDTTTTADLCVQCIVDKIQGTEPWTSSFCDERCCNSLNLPSKDPKRVATLVYLLLWCRGSRHLSWNGR